MLFLRKSKSDSLSFRFELIKLYFLKNCRTWAISIVLYTSFTDAKGLLHMLDKPYTPVIAKEKNKQTLKITSTSYSQVQ